MAHERVLITGAAGFIGANACSQLRQARFVPLPIVRQPLPGDGLAGERTHIDLSGREAARALIDRSPDLIVHLAAVLPPRFDGDAARQAAAENRRIDDAVISAAAELACPLVFLSGTSLYGCVSRPCDEDTPIKPRGPYLEEKARSEDLVLGLSHGFVLRVSSPYGRGQRAQTVLRSFVQQALAGKDLRWHGAGTREQDFCAVEDVAGAIVAACGASRRGICNVASGEAITMRDLAALVIELTGSRGAASAAGVEDAQEGCLARFAIGKAERELGWRPAVRLAQGLARLIASERGEMDHRPERR